MISDRNTLKFTSLLGGQSNGAICSLLEYGAARILLDCGKDNSVSSDSIIELAKRLVKEGGIDVILLSHADMQHVRN